MRFWLPALVTLAVLPLGAHHPFTPYYDASTLVSMSGPIVELRTINPHVVWIIDGTGPDGRTGRWAFEGLPPNAYQYRGLEDYKERLNPGTVITISGWPAKEAVVRLPNALRAVRGDACETVKRPFAHRLPGDR